MRLIKPTIHLWSIFLTLYFPPGILYYTRVFLLGWIMWLPLINGIWVKILNHSCKSQFGRVCLFVFTYFCFYSLGWIISINLSSNLLILLSVSSNLILSLSEYFISAILFFNLKISVWFFIIVSGSIDILNLVRYYCHIFSWFKKNMD